MSSIWSSKALRRYLLAALALLGLLTASTAFAVGRVEWKTKSVKPLSDGNSWRLEMKVFLPRPPDFAHMPVKFEFKPTVYFERSLVDGDQEVTRDVPLVGRQPLVESVEIGFLDPGTGEIQKRTKFTFKLRRDRGYDAGRYRVTLKDGRNGRTIGRSVTITLQGENEVIDRRTMDFSAKPKKKEEKEEAKEEAPPDQDENAPEQDEYGDDEAAGTDDYEQYGEDDEPGEIQEKPGACGCRTVGLRGSSPLGLSGAALLLAAGLIIRSRRRR